MPAEGRLTPQAKVGVNARRGLSEEDERDIAKPLTTRRGLAYTYLVDGEEGGLSALPLPYLGDVNNLFTTAKKM